MIKLKRNGCICPCYLEVERLETGLEIGDNAVISKVKQLKNGETRVEIKVLIESGSVFKDDEIRTDSYQTIKPNQP